MNEIIKVSICLIRWMNNDQLFYFQIDNYIWSVCRFLKAAVIWAITTSSLMISIFVGSSFMADMSIVLPLFWTITRKNCLRFHYCHNGELFTFAYEFSFKGWSLPTILQKLFLFWKDMLVFNPFKKVHSLFVPTLCYWKR